ncbi:MAG: DEAD/DEAH box helicase [Thaumarchaeota archaeon]|nr:DEAD/DEAH box helicase [Nitrososphaerota archaeon]
MTDPYDDLASPLPHDRVDEMIGDADPPKAVREALHSRSVRLVDYKERARQDFARGQYAGAVGLDGRIAAHLGGNGPLYAYQDEAIGRILDGESVVIEAPTAAGKTVAFLAPVVHMVSRSAKSGIKALFVYPTKALGNDQRRKIEEMASLVGARVDVFDGDSDDRERERVTRDPPDILVTNFDTLHTQMIIHKHLAGHLRQVGFLVADEAHSYTGAFGSNVHHVIARLKRLSGEIQCVAASATLKDSGEFCSGLFGQEMRVIRENGRLSTLDLAIVSPLADRSRPDRRIQRHKMVVKIAKMMHREGSKTILFSNSHRGAEMVGVLGAKEGLPIEIHRAGLPASHLRGVEARLRSGETRVVSCTPTLELGMDIGGVNTVVSEIVPANRFVQRIGRAGRRGERGCAFLVLGHDPISQYYRRHPQDYLDDEWNPRVNPKNQWIEDIHTVAMAADTPLGHEEISARGPSVLRCWSRGHIRFVGKSAQPTPSGKLALQDHNIRGLVDPVFVLDGERRLGERARPMALAELHPGAVYMSQGRSYRIVSLSERDNSAAAVRMPPGDARHTSAVVKKRIDDLHTIRSRECLDTDLRYCRMSVTMTVGEYIERDHANPSYMRYFPLDRPIEHTFETHGIRIWPHPLGGSAAGSALQEWALHAMEHAMIEASCMVVGAAHSDLGSANQGRMVYVYDNTEGENGTSSAMYDRMEEIAIRARDIIAGCGCSEDERGCVHCTFSHSCGRGNDGLHKDGAKELLQRMADARTESGHNPGLGAQLAISGREGCVQ